MLLIGELLALTMAYIYPFKEFTPQIAPDVFVSPNATIVGEVEIQAASSVWFNAVIRGDVGGIVIGERSNIQDGVIIHCTTDLSQTLIGDDVVIGHGAILHGCQLEDRVLIGMGAIVLDLAVVPSDTIIAAGALVPEGKKLESGYIYAGVPAKPLKRASQAQLEDILVISRRYVKKAAWYRQTIL